MFVVFECVEKSDSIKIEVPYTSLRGRLKKTPTWLATDSSVEKLCLSFDIRSHENVRTFRNKLKTLTSDSTMFLVAVEKYLTSSVRLEIVHIHKGASSERYGKFSLIRGIPTKTVYTLEGPKVQHGLYTFFTSSHHV